MLAGYKSTLRRIYRQKILSQITLRFIGAKAQYRENTNEVQLRGKVITGKHRDLPTLIWLPDLIDNAESFEPFFTNSSSKILDVRNIHLLNYRNCGSSDHHNSMEMADIANDIIRYMDQNYITTATIGGHGFGAKVAIATATDNLNRFTGIMCLDGGPVDQRFHDSYTELKKSLKRLEKLEIEHLSSQDVIKNIDKIIDDPNWRKVFKQNVNMAKGTPQWNFNMKIITDDMKKVKPVVASWSESYGLWPGRAWVQIPAYSKWIHLSTNTLPFYDVFPRLENQFPSSDFNIFGNDETPANHWPHLSADANDIFHLSNRMWRFLRFKDGVHVLLADRTEVGWHYIPDRGADPSTGTGQGEYTPEHVHHNWKHSNVYEKSRTRREVDGADRGQHLPKGSFSDESNW